jgi:peptide/nickel transport system permease protein
LACATKEYVTAAKSQGATARRVILKDIFPNIAPALIAYTVFTLGGVIATEGALAFLGYSVAIPTPSWGNMIGEASNLDQNNIYLLLAPAIGLFLTLISLNYIGERIRTHFDTAESKL